MMTAIRKNLRNFVAVVALIVIAAGVSYYILQEQRLRIPILEEKPFELKAEFETAQAVVPGQGQTLRVAGVRIGDVSDVELEDGSAVVTFDVDREFLPIYKDATILMRPRTGLKDMFFALDPGTQDAGEYAEGDVVPMTNTAPDVNLDEVLAALDTDSREYLRALIVGAGQGLDGRDEDLGRMLAALGPVNRDLDQLSTEVAKRDENLKRLVSNLSSLTRAVGQQDQDIATLVDASNTTLEAIGEQDPDVQQATALLPEALRQTRQALAVAKDFGDQLGPAFNELRPFARKLPEVNEAATSLAKNTTPVIENQIRPLVRAARPVVPDLRGAANKLSNASKPLTKVGGRLNELRQHGGVQPARRRGARRSGPRRGLPVLGRVARAQRDQRVHRSGRERRLPPHLLHGELREHHQPAHRRPRAVPSGPARADPGAPRQRDRARRTVRAGGGVRGLMQKQAPSIGRILVAAGFTLSCFGLILFLWIAFGGPTPLKAKSYRITAYFPEATQLAVESDVRIGGVSVGKVKEIGLAPSDQRVEGYDTTEATIEIEPQYAPISSDARAILRQKTLLGETYVELTSGTEPEDADEGEAPPVALGASSNATDAEAEAIEPIEEGGELAVSQTRNATQIDEIFNALDDETRDAFQRWQENVAGAIRGRGQDVNDALGNLGPFATDASEILAALNRQKVALKGLVRDTGTVFAALSSRDQELAGAIVGSEQTFGALADSDEALAESFQILPTFQRETRATLLALDDFQVNARPLVQKLLPVANDISPTLRSVRQLSPNLENLFRDLGPLINAGRRGIPALGRFLGPEGLRPMLNALAPILGNVAPAVSYLREYKKTITDFLAVPGFGLSNTLPETAAPQGSPNGQDTARPYLKQLGYLGTETLSIWGTRLPTNRGNAYPAPDYLANQMAASGGIFDNFDCKNTDFTPDPTGLLDQPADETPVDYLEPAASSGASSDQSATFAPCFIQDPPDVFGDGRAPNLMAAP